VSDKVETLNY